MRLWLGLLLLSVLASGCEERSSSAPSEPSPPSPASAIAELGIDAGLLGEPADPPAPAGDLKADMDRFVNVDTCVAERAKLDPLVADALGAIGYETFLRDACRLLEATKDKKRDACERIDSSALRARCQSWVAMNAESADACPMQFEGLLTRGRDPSCVAIAARDPRLCAGESGIAQRATCEAMVLRDPARCEPLLPGQRLRCQREVTRWRSALMPPLEGLEKLPAPRAKLTVHGASGTPDPPVTEADLSSDFARGVVVVTAGERMRIELGTVVESEAARIGASPQKRPRIGLALLLEPTPKEPRPVVQKLELELPGEAPIVSPPVACDCKITTARAANQRGGEAKVVIDGTLNSSGRSFTFSADITTFVRDVVPEGRLGEGSRVLPPLHPALPPRGRGAR